MTVNELEIARRPGDTVDRGWNEPLFLERIDSGCDGFLRSNVVRFDEPVAGVAAPVPSMTTWHVRIGLSRTLLGHRGCPSSATRLAGAKACTERRVAHAESACSSESSAEGSRCPFTDSMASPFSRELSPRQVVLT